MWTVSNARNRKGFTLIELMIVIAIIIILAAIAIPNYLKMTERAKKARIASDFESLATALEAYRTDWGTYPVSTGENFGKHADGSAANSTFCKELTGNNATTNTTGSTTATGEEGPIEYIKLGTIQSMVNPFFPTEDYYYASSTSGNHWLLSAHIPDHTTGGNTYKSVYRTDSTTQLTENTNDYNSLTIDDTGAVSP